MAEPAASVTSKCNNCVEVGLVRLCEPRVTLVFLRVARASELVLVVVAIVWLKAGVRLLLVLRFVPAV